MSVAKDDKVDDKDQIDDKEMPLLEHLVELRNRLVYSCLALFIGFAVCYFFAEQI